ncbi:ABC transporter substrate-binding protein [Arcobacter sp. YIC-464]|uniref:ABC transporter substrate-binding protein n=1 Tax=Arcobacter sp. YIC-464 TaxID=3376631 RepID=UPI003C1D4B8C
MGFKKGIFLLFLCVVGLYAQSDKLDLIKKSNELRVCIWPEYYGISYLDTRTQKLVGIDSDLAKELAKDLGVNLKYVSSSFATLVNDVTNDKCDIAMFAIGNTESRRAKMRFTTPHLSSDIYAITTKTNQRVKTWNDIDKKGIVVAVAKGTYHEPVMKSKLKNADLLVVNSFKAREQEVKAGRADVFMTDYPFGKRMIATTNWARLVTPDSTYHKTPYAWAMAYGNDKFYERVEQFISDIKKDGRLLDLAKKNSLEPIAKLK